ncbi:MAG: hypothetical protein H0W62_04300 [Chitinophagales bacterium]|nr:hypothetical protein [Chitinophagales bacterium]
MSKRQLRQKAETQKKPNAAKREPGTFFQHNRSLCLVIAIFTFLAYAHSLSNGWTDWDDEGYVLKNTLVKTFDLKGIFTSYVLGNYHPVTVLVQSIEYQFFSDNAFGFHLVSLLLHIINSLLVFWFTLLLTKNNNIGLIAAILFAVHPLHVESVSWIAAQKDLLYVLFYLGALIQYAKYSNEGKIDRKKYVLIILLFLLSLLSKGQAVTLPVIMILINWFQKKKISIRSQLDKVPLFIIAIIFGIVAIFAQQSVHAVQDINAYSGTQRSMFASYAIINYLQRLFIPVKLSAYYAYPQIIDGKYLAIVYASPVLLLIISFLVFYFRRNTLLVFGSLFFIINIFLVLQFLPVGGALTADRYSYLSFLGLFIWLASMVARAWENYKVKSAGILIIIAATWVIFLFIDTVIRSGVWKNSETLWTNVIENYKGFPIAYNNLGWYYLQTNQLLLAKSNFYEALRLNPTYDNALINRYSVFKKLNNMDSALIDAKKVMKIRPDLADPYMDRGVSFGMAEKFDSALMDFHTALKIKPKYADAYQNIGNLYGMRNMPDSAISNYQLALKYDPKITGLHSNLGSLYLQKPDYKLSIEEYTKAILEDGSNGNNYYGRMQALEKSGQFSAAYQDALQAVKLGIDIPQDLIIHLKNKAGIK